VGELWKTAGWIWVPFELVIGIGRGMGVFDGVEIVEWEEEAAGKRQRGLCGVVILCRKHHTNFLIPRSRRNSNGITPNEGAKCR